MFSGNKEAAANFINITYFPQNESHLTHPVTYLALPNCVHLCVCAMTLRLQLVLSGRCTQIVNPTATPNLGQEL